METADRISRMEKEAMHQMLHYHERSSKQIFKDAAKKAAGRYVAPEDLIFWPTGLLANTLGNILASGNVTNGEILSALKEYFDRWIAKGMPILYIDDILCGNALIDLYQATGEEKYLAGIHKMADYLLSAQFVAEGKGSRRDGAGSLLYRETQQNGYIFADGIGMVCPFLSRYGAEICKEEDQIEVKTEVKNKVFDLAALQIVNMLTYGMDDGKFLPYHGYEYKSMKKYGIIGWGRAVGWLLMGMAGTLSYLPKEHKEFDRIKKAFLKLIDVVISYQKENGAFCWQLEALEGPEDSSATAMIAQAIIMGKRAEIMSEELTQSNQKEVIERAALFIVECEENGHIAKCSGECKGFAEYPQIYSAYPWSLGPGLAVLLEATEANMIE